MITRTWGRPHTLTITNRATGQTVVTARAWTSAGVSRREHRFYDQRPECRDDHDWLQTWQPSDAILAAHAVAASLVGTVPGVALGMWLTR